MPTYRSKTSTQGRNMAGARALWRATGMHTEDFEKPIIAGRQLLYPIRTRSRSPQGFGSIGVP
jgi:hypothetical protein